MKTTSLFMITALLAAGLSACGGTDSSVTPVTQVPAAAADSAQAYAEYVRDLPASDSTEPLSLDLIATAPTSEADDQIILN